MIERSESGNINAPYFAEEVRRELAREYKEEGLYRGGMAVRTSIVPDYQKIAVESLRKGLMEYDQRWGYRGPVVEMGLEDCVR